ncbi:MAG: hypothetical protein DMG87_07725 [Acidobacteria bacterium]|nr:MAG: hypothetical protein DMG87_07725 [Acidobacteriota bacterium]
MRLRIYIGLLLAIVALAIFLMSCSGGSKPGTVNTSISDPPTCAAPQGPYRHVYVTVNDVLIHQSASASANDAGWIHLASGLKDNPLQVDLLGVANQCFLAMLGSAEIEPGTYQQIRVVLAPNSASVNNNKCGNVANCLMLTSDPSNTPQALQLSSETQTGIKIPSGQIAGGSFTVGSGQTKDLNIDFDACASVVVQGSGQYRLKPVLHAGEVSLQSASSSISGTIIDGSSQQAVVGGNTVVALEQADGSAVMQAVPASNGSFVFCPVADGTYNLVAVAIDGSGNTYAATVITGVKAGDSLGTVPLTPAGLPASISGQVTTSTESAGTAADLSISAVQSIGNSMFITVPLAQQSAATATLTTAAGASCPPSTDCVSYTLSVPAANPSIGTFNSGGNQTPATPASGEVDYTVGASAFVPGLAGQQDCSPSNMQTSLTDTNATLSVTAGTPVTAATLGFTGCQ